MGFILRHHRRLRHASLASSSSSSPFIPQNKQIVECGVPARAIKQFAKAGSGYKEIFQTDNANSALVLNLEFED